MTKKEMRNLSDDDLYKLSIRKNRHGRYTKEANEAMEIRKERSCHWYGVNIDCSEPEATYQGYDPNDWEDKY